MRPHHSVGVTVIAVVTFAVAVVAAAAGEPETVVSLSPHAAEEGSVRFQPIRRGR